MSIICYSVTFILGIVGNGLVIWISGFKMKKTVNTIWFFNLGFTDFCFCLFLPLHITEWANNGIWPFGPVMCKLVYTTLFLNMSVSISFLTIISVDRCVSIQCPVWSKNHRNCKLATSISVIIWFLCLVLSSPYLAFYNIEKHQDENISYCSDDYAAWINITTSDEWTFDLRNKAMFITRFVSMFLIPFFIVLVCYGLIAFHVRKSSRLSGSRRTFRIIIIIVLCFFSCWFLFHLMPFLNFMKIGMNEDLRFFMHHFADCLAYFNSCLNPMVYVFTGRSFKKVLRKSIPFLLENTFREREDI
ncbi:hypothetical protein GDO86_012227 [Hymenochirus boettgeri]|uniref:G-protein coupled receptors family 1 profile domain-containing protein n=1 Tax=Hymenochirus boettgeri TaxID=247094 RepID=A0A8T2IP81_9PIPI|nr:hypothetical protein GDO86_012227 [Hymenochirus boettgeri]